MRYDASYAVERLTDVQQEICVILIAREMVSPNGGRMSAYFGGSRGASPDDPAIKEIATRILMRPDNRQQEALRADAIHASFGIADFIAAIGGPMHLQRGHVGYRRAPLWTAVCNRPDGWSE